MNDSQNDDDFEMGKHVAGLGCVLGVRGIILFILLLIVFAAVGSVFSFLTPAT